MIPIAAKLWSICKGGYGPHLCLERPPGCSGEREVREAPGKLGTEHCRQEMVAWSSERGAPGMQPDRDQPRSPGLRPVGCVFTGKCPSPSQPICSEDEGPLLVTQLDRTSVSSRTSDQPPRPQCPGDRADPCPPWGGTPPLQAAASSGSGKGRPGCLWWAVG